MQHRRSLMRDYGSVHTCFWSNPDIQELSSEAKLLALYLLTGPHTNMLGCFRLPVGYVAEDLKWSAETVSKRFAELFQKGFVTRDEATGWVLIPRFLEWNPIDNPNQAKSLCKLFNQIPEKSFIYKDLIEVLLTHSKYFEEPFRNRLETLSKGFREPFRNQDQEQKQDQYQDPKEKQAKEKNPVEKNSTEKITTEKNPPIEKSILEIFQFWQKALQHPNAQLDASRRKCIKQALKLGYSVTQLCEAITGCSLTPHNLGHNERGERYDGLHIIFKNADNIERFIRNCHNPPTPSKLISSSTQTTRKQHDNFNDKQYTQTPIEDIFWLKQHE